MSVTVQIKAGAPGNLSLGHGIHVHQPGETVTLTDDEFFALDPAFVTAHLIVLTNTAAAPALIRCLLQTSDFGVEGCIEARLPEQPDAQNYGFPSVTVSRRTDYPAEGGILDAQVGWIGQMPVPSSQLIAAMGAVSNGVVVSTRLEVYRRDAAGYLAVRRQTAVLPSSDVLTWADSTDWTVWKTTGVPGITVTGPFLNAAGVSSYDVVVQFQLDLDWG